MAVTLDATLQNLVMDAIRGGVANGTLEILTAADAVLVVFGLNASAGSVTGATWSLVWDNSTVAATGTGTAAKAQIKNSGGTPCITGLTVGTSGSDINLDNTSINSGQNVTITSATISY
jgi:hypothetical protein